MTNAIVVIMTASDRDEARRIAELLIERHLAACVQILPEIESIYRWKGAIERSPESLILAKSTSEKFAEIETAVRSIHSYESPEIIALPVTDASPPYLQWLLESVQG